MDKIEVYDPILYAMDKLIESLDDGNVDSSIIKSITIRYREIIKAVNIYGVSVYGCTLDELYEKMSTHKNVILMTDEEFAEYQKVLKLKGLLRESDIL